MFGQESSQGTGQDQHDRRQEHDRADELANIDSEDDQQEDREENVVIDNAAPIIVMVLPRVLLFFLGKCFAYSSAVPNSAFAGASGDPTRPHLLECFGDLSRALGQDYSCGRLGTVLLPPLMGVGYWRS